MSAMLVLLGEVFLSRATTFLGREVTEPFIGTILAIIAMFSLLVTDRNSQATEEIVARHTLGLELDFVIHAEQRAGPGDPGHVLAGLEEYCLVLDRDLSLAEEIRFLPLP